MNAKVKLAKILAATALGLSMSVAMAEEGLAPNGSYSSVGFSLFKTNYANPSAGEASGYGGLGFKFSYQLLPNMIVGLQHAGGSSNDGSPTIRESQGGLFVGFVMGVSSSVDIGGLLGPVTKRYETCLGSLCTTTEDKGSDVGLFGKWWLNDSKTFNLGLNLDSYTYSNTTTKYSSSAVSVSYKLADQHEFSLTGARLRDTSGTDINTSSSMAYHYHF